MHALIEHLPGLGCLRSKSGKILAVSARLLEVEGKRRSEVVGRSIRAVWPDRAKEWSRLDSIARRSRKPFSLLEFEDGRWLRSVRIAVKGGAVWWAAEEISDSVKLNALRLMMSFVAANKAGLPSEPSIAAHADIVQALLTAPDATALATRGILPADSIAVAMRLLW